MVKACRLETEDTKLWNRANDVPELIALRGSPRPGFASAVSTSRAATAAPEAAAAATAAAAAVVDPLGANGGLRGLVGDAHSWLALKSATAASVRRVSPFGTATLSSFSDRLRDKIRSTALSASAPDAFSFPWS